MPSCEYRCCRGGDREEGNELAIWLPWGRALPALHHGSTVTAHAAQTPLDWGLRTRLLYCIGALKGPGLSRVISGLNVTARVALKVVEPSAYGLFVVYRSQWIPLNLCCCDGNLKVHWGHGRACLCEFDVVAVTTILSRVIKILSRFKWIWLRKNLKSLSSSKVQTINKGCDDLDLYLGGCTAHSALRRQ